MASDSKANVLMVGTGEYTTGYVGGKAADSDKGAGVVALTMFDLRRRGKVDRVGMCGVNVRVNDILYIKISYFSYERLQKKNKCLLGQRFVLDAISLLFSVITPL